MQQQIEFEAMPFQHTVRIPDYIPDGVSVQVILSFDDAAVTNKKPRANWKASIETMIATHGQEVLDSDWLVADLTDEERKRRHKEAVTNILANRAKMKPVTEEEVRAARNELRQL